MLVNPKILRYNCKNFNKINFFKYISFLHQSRINGFLSMQTTGCLILIETMEYLENKTIDKKMIRQL